MDRQKCLIEVPTVDNNPAVLKEREVYFSIVVGLFWLLFSMCVFFFVHQRCVCVCACRLLAYGLGSMVQGMNIRKIWARGIQPGAPHTSLPTYLEFSHVNWEACSGCCWLNLFIMSKKSRNHAITQPEWSNSQIFSKFQQ